MFWCLLYHRVAFFKNSSEPEVLILAMVYSERVLQCVSETDDLVNELEFLSLDSGCEERARGGVTVVRGDPAWARPVQTHQQLCQEHPRPGGLRRTSGETGTDLIQ